MPEQSRRFKNILYLFVVFKCAYWLYNYELLFGNHSIIYRAEGHTNFLKDLAYVLYNNKSTLLPLYFIIAVFTLCGTMLWRQKNNTGIDFAIWLLIENIHFSVYATLTSGDFLLNQFLFFNIFIATDYLDTHGKYRDVYVALHNTAVIAVILQVFLVYIVSGTSKVMDHDWITGQAVSRVNIIEHFSLGPGIGSGSWQQTATYAVMVYQLAFPVLIWFRLLKIPLLLIGAVMHLYIALVMGLLTFGLLMILSYIYFWPAKKQTA